MYKRPARVLFLAADAGRAALAADCVGRMGHGWAEARAGLAAQGDSSPARTTGLDWADLLVTLDHATHARLPPLPPAVRAVCWPLAEAPDTARQQLESRVSGMIGGMRMLARLDT